MNDYEKNECDLNSNNVVVLGTERKQGEKFNRLLSIVTLDFCIYDEIYKLSSKRMEDSNDDRLIIMNYVYGNMLQRTKNNFLYTQNNNLL